MKKLILPIIALFLVVTSIQLLVNKQEVELTFETTDNSEDKIIFEGFNLTQNASIDEVQEEVSIEAKQNVTIQIQFDYNFENDNRHLLTDEADIDAYIMEHRLQAASYHKEINEYMKSNLDLVKYQDLYVSEFSPFIDFYYDVETFVENADLIIGELIDNDFVNKAYIQNVEKPENKHLDNALYFSNLYDTVKNADLTGNNVTVGVLEVGILNKRHPNFSGLKNIQVRDELFYIETITEHTTQVASVIGGRYGIAPNANILSVEVNGSLNGEIDWMLARGVHLINMSFGDKVGQGYYSSRSAYVDYVIKTYNLSVVAAVGNDGLQQGWINDPAVGYNVIAVGATNSTASTMDLYSSYQDRTGAHKPTIVAPSSFKVPGYDKVSSGTSFSAPVVTGAVALLMEKYPILKVYPERVIALLTMTARNVSGFPPNQSSGMNDRAGAGLLDFQAALDLYAKSYIFHNTSGQSGPFRTMEIYLNQGDTFIATVAWLVQTNGSIHFRYTDYDIRLFDTEGRVVAAAISSTNNVEKIQYMAPVSGSYRVVITQNGPLQTGPETVAFAFRVR